MKDLKARNFSPVYILMGDESYYIDLLCDYITENVLQPEEKDFNQVLLLVPKLRRRRLPISARAIR